MRTVTNLTRSACCWPRAARRCPSRDTSNWWGGWTRLVPAGAGTARGAEAVSTLRMSHLPCSHHVAAVHREYTRARGLEPAVQRRRSSRPQGGRVERRALALQGRTACFIDRAATPAAALTPGRCRKLVFDRCLHAGAASIPAPHGLGLGLPLSQSIITRQGRGGRLLSPRPGERAQLHNGIPSRRCPAGKGRITPDRRAAALSLFAGGFQTVLVELSDRAAVPGGICATSSSTDTPAGVIPSVFSGWRQARLSMHQERRC